MLERSFYVEDFPSRRHYVLTFFLAVILLVVVGVLIHFAWEEYILPKLLRSELYQRWCNRRRFADSVHEAGHAIYAWFSVQHLTITSAYINPTGGGQVLYNYQNDNVSIASLWDDCALSLAGIAAERLHVGFIDFNGTEIDLREAVEDAEKIIALRVISDLRSPPWRRAPKMRLCNQVKAYIDRQHSTDVRYILRESYAYAYGILKENPQAFGRVQQCIFNFKPVANEEMQELCGPRSDKLNSA